MTCLLEVAYEHTQRQEEQWHCEWRREHEVNLHVYELDHEQCKRIDEVPRPSAQY